MLEKREREFLNAYRFHMVKVQEELNALKARTNETELKARQQAKIHSLEVEINKYRNDCSNIMKFVNMQKQLIADFTLRKRELRDDEDFLEIAIGEARVAKAQTRIDITKKHKECEEQNFLNQSTVREIHAMQQSILQKDSYAQSLFDPTEFQNSSLPATQVDSIVAPTIHDTSLDNLQKKGQSMQMSSDAVTRATASKQIQLGEQSMLIENENINSVLVAHNQSFKFGRPEVDKSLFNSIHPDTSVEEPT